LEYHERIEYLGCYGGGGGGGNGGSLDPPSVVGKVEITIDGGELERSRPTPRIQCL
jgi:hypothetical protein